MKIPQNNPNIGLYGNIVDDKAEDGSVIFRVPERNTAFLVNPDAE